jgi:hypothetical protein
MTRYPVDEPRAEAGAHLEWQCAGHPETTVGGKFSRRHRQPEIC